MTQVPKFFLPTPKPDTWEADFAKWAGRPVPDMAERIYSINYLHDGIEWTATVGEKLHGIKRQIKRGMAMERSTPVSDLAIVFAIFPGDPYIVVTNHRVVENVATRWENPFMAGKPMSVEYFS